MNLDKAGKATAVNSDPVIVRDISSMKAQKAFCLEAVLKTPGAARFEIFLQSRDWPKKGNRFVAGRSIYQAIPAGLSRVRMILPVWAKTRYLRIDPVGVKEKLGRLDISVVKH